MRNQEIHWPFFLAVILPLDAFFPPRPNHPR